MLVFLTICENPRFFAHTAKPLTGWRALAFPFKVSLPFSSSKQQSGRVYGDRNRAKQTASLPRTPPMRQPKAQHTAVTTLQAEPIAVRFFVTKHSSSASGKWLANGNEHFHRPTSCLYTLLFCSYYYNNIIY